MREIEFVKEDAHIKIENYYNGHYYGRIEFVCYVDDVETYIPYNFDAVYDGDFNLEFLGGVDEELYKACEEHTDKECDYYCNKIIKRYWE